MSGFTDLAKMLERQAIDLDALVGEMLATININVEREGITFRDETCRSDFKNLFVLWRERYLAATEDRDWAELVDDVIDEEGERLQALLDEQAAIAELRRRAAKLDRAVKLRESE